MIRATLFGVLLVATCAYAILRGGAPERHVAYLYLAAAVATPIAAMGIVNSFAAFEGGVFLVDLLLLIGVGWIAMTADRFWPLAAGALQLDGVGVHLMRVFQPDMFPRAYALMTIVWSYLALAVLAVGTYRHPTHTRRGVPDNGYRGRR